MTRRITEPALHRHRARVEFRRATEDAPWVLAGAWIDALTFYPAAPGVEPVAWRLPRAALVGWADLPPIVARDPVSAGAIALDLARRRWPRAVRADVPHANVS